jgi:hypothetical protein
LSLLACLELFLAKSPQIVARQVDGPRLQEGAVITGQVLDELGNPAPNVMVYAMRVRFPQGQPRLATTGDSVSTNERGAYRIGGLPRGQYYILSSGLLTTRVTKAYDPPAYAPMFYPGTADFRAAQRVAVERGQTISDVTIRTIPVYLATISGIVVDATGSVVTSGSVTASPRGGILPGKSRPIRPDGTFRIEDVPPGEYRVSTSPPRTPRSPGDVTEGPEFTAAIVQVDGQDLTGLRLAPNAMSVSGKIFFDNPGAAQSLSGSAITLRAHMVDARGPTGPRPKVNDDFTFALKTVPGLIALDAVVASSYGDQSRWQVRAIFANGAEVTDTGIDVQRDTDDVNIVLTTDIQQLSGTVSDERGAAVKDYVVVVFPQERARWSTALNRYVAVGRPDAKGVFKITTLPPGQYYATALDRVSDNEWQDPEFLDTLTQQAIAFSLFDDDTRTIRLTLSRIT